jgi:hypothetical protein
VNLQSTISVFAYGTSEGVEKSWDTRGRGRKIDWKKINSLGRNERALMSADGKILTFDRASQVPRATTHQNLLIQHLGNNANFDKFMYNGGIRIHNYESKGIAEIGTIKGDTVERAVRVLQELPTLTVYFEYNPHYGPIGASSGGNYFNAGGEPKKVVGEIRSWYREKTGKDLMAQKEAE